MYNRKDFARKCIERMEALGMKGKRADDAALHFYCGAANILLAEHGEKHPDVQSIAAHCALIVSVRGMIGVRGLVGDVPL